MCIRSSFSRFLLVEDLDNGACGSDALGTLLP